MTNDQVPGVSHAVTFHQNTASLWLRGIGLLSGLIPLGFASYEIRSIPDWTGIAMATAIIALAGVCALFGALMLRAAWHRALGVTLTSNGIVETTLFGSSQAEWASLGPFSTSLRERQRGSVAKCGRARIIGPGVSGKLQGQMELVVQDWFTQPIETIIETLNEWRQKYSKAVIPEECAFRTALRESGVGLAPKRHSWVLPMTIIGIVDIGILYELYVML